MMKLKKLLCVCLLIAVVFLTMSSVTFAYNSDADDVGIDTTDMWDNNDFSKDTNPIVPEEPAEQIIPEYILERATSEELEEMLAISERTGAPVELIPVYYDCYRHIICETRQTGKYVDGNVELIPISGRISGGTETTLPDNTAEQVIPEYIIERATAEELEEMLAISERTGAPVELIPVYYDCYRHIICETRQTGEYVDGNVELIPIPGRISGGAEAFKDVDAADAISH